MCKGERAMRWIVIASLLVAVVLGLAGGVGGFTFWYAQGASYLSNDPEACANCHVMREQLAAWSRGPHHAVATCNDCHTPHDFAGKWLTKASNGYHHSLAFTTGDFHEPIQIKARNLAVTEAACRTCHGDVVQGIDAVAGHGGDPESLQCTRCHASVGHMQ
jgi:cytochrome c nitrite reductase small subunit